MTGKIAALLALFTLGVAQAQYVPDINGNLIPLDQPNGLPRLDQSGRSPIAQAPASMGSITRAGKSGTVAVTLPIITLGSSYSITTPVADPKSGPAQVDDWCGVVLVGGAPPAGMLMPTCAVKTAGVATIYFPAIAGVAGGSLSIIVHWRG